MSDLAAAAAAMGIPESLVQRSAEARAQETGSTVEEILAAWAGGDGAPTPSTSPSGDVASTDAPTSDVPEPEPVAPVVVAPAEPQQPVAQTGSIPSTRSGKPPTLVGAPDNPLSTMVGAVGLFLLIFLVAFVGPTTQPPEPGARTSDIPLSATAEDGMALYSSLGCAACHTQMVRPVVADIGLGAVTLSDANQPLGTRRFGPDLSDSGARLSNSEIQSIVQGLNDHPSLTLSSTDMDALVAYLLESNTSGGGS